jgi:hypothetical protein
VAKSAQPNTSQRAAAARLHNAARHLSALLR